MEDRTELTKLEKQRIVVDLRSAALLLSAAVERIERIQMLLPPDFFPPGTPASESHPSQTSSPSSDPTSSTPLTRYSFTIPGVGELSLSTHLLDPAKPSSER